MFTTEKIRRKAINPALLSVALSASVMAQVPGSQSYADVAHEHKGCTENSVCDAEMGQTLLRWEGLVSRWNSAPAPQVLTEIRRELRERGLPLEFYTHASAQSGFRPVSWASDCPAHNPPPPAARVWRGRAFIKGTDNGHVLVQRGDTEHRVPFGELLQLGRVRRLGERPVDFLLPLGEQPLYFAKGKLHAVVEIDDLYVVLAIPPTGPWEVNLPDPNGQRKAQDTLEDVACPKDALAPTAPFMGTRCRRVLDVDSGKPVVVQLFSGCG